jgi:hypothetical protein
MPARGGGDCYVQATYRIRDNQVLELTANSLL